MEELIKLLEEKGIIRRLVNAVNMAEHVSSHPYKPSKNDAVEHILEVEILNDDSMSDLFFKSCIEIGIGILKEHILKQVHESDSETCKESEEEKDSVYSVILDILERITSRLEDDLK